MRISNFYLNRYLWWQNKTNVHTDRRSGLRCTVGDMLQILYYIKLSSSNDKTTILIVADRASLIISSNTKKYSYLDHWSIRNFW